VTLRLAVLLSGGGRTLLNLVDAIAAGRLDAEVPLVISSRRTAKGVGRARDAGLHVDVLRPRDFDDKAAFCARQTQVITAADVDLIIMAGYLLHYPVPTGWEGRVLNIHPSLLPKFGGQGMYGDRVHAAVLAARETESGCTVHVVDDDYDSGPVIAQSRVPVLADDDTDALAARVFEAECRTFPEAIANHAATLIEQGALSPRR